MTLQLTPEILIFCSLGVIILAAYALHQYRAALRYRREAEVLRLVAQAAPPGSDLKSVAQNLIEVAMSVFRAKGYYFYARSVQSNELVLTAVRTARETAITVGPSYSGLAEFTAPEYTPPLAVASQEVPPRTSVIAEGDLKFIAVPFARGEVAGLLRIGPLGKSMPGAHDLKTLDLIASAGTGIVYVLMERANLDERFRSLSAIAKASSAAASSVLGGRQFVDTLLGLGARIARAAAGAIVVVSGTRREVYATTGFTVEEAAALRDGLEAHIPHVYRLDQPVVASVSNSSASTSVMRRIKPVSVAAFPVTTSGSLLLYWFSSPVSLAQYTITALRSIADRIGHALQNEQIYRDMSRSYLESLKSIVAAIDSVEVYTVSHSALVAKYSRGIAEEMGVRDVDTVELAAYLHDIGMAMLDEQILFKKGRYEKHEYEDMKTHTEVGAMLVASVVEPPGLAEIIRHHHERWDGWGYPAGLRGVEIPVGARIVAVADTFNAKVSSRNYRPGLPFGRAIADIKAGAGSQFDPEVVRAFERWWAKKQAKQSPDRSLEPCWRMKECPASLATSCPASTSDRPCWTVNGVKCELHGDVCDHCIVRSEWEYRVQNLPRYFVQQGKVGDVV